MRLSSTSAHPHRADVTVATRTFCRRPAGLFGLVGVEDPVTIRRLACSADVRHRRKPPIRAMAGGPCQWTISHPRLLIAVAQPGGVLLACRGTNHGAGCARASSAGTALAEVFAQFVYRLKVLVASRGGEPVLKIW